MEIINNMSYDNFCLNLVRGTFPPVKLQPQPPLLKEYGNMSYGYYMWSYRNRFRLQYMTQQEFFDSSPFSIENYSWVDSELELKDKYFGDFTENYDWVDNKLELMYIDQQFQYESHLWQDNEQDNWLINDIQQDQEDQDDYDSISAEYADDDDHTSCLSLGSDSIDTADIYSDMDDLRQDIIIENKLSIIHPDNISNSDSIYTPTPDSPF